LSRLLVVQNGFSWIVGCHIFGGHHPRKRVIQYAVAYRLVHWRLWNTIEPGDDSGMVFG
jgi:hypothetical protein